MSRSARWLALAALSLAAGRAGAADVAWTALVGWQGGGALRATATISGAVQTMPLSFDLGAGHAFVDPGRPDLARAVFINDATNGTPEESGGVWDLRADAVYGLQVKGFRDAGVFAGVRYSMFSGRFRFVGGNEDFTVTSNAWGMGVGLRGSLPVAERWSLTASLGLDWFPTQTLYGHDTSYSSNGESVNGRPGYGWSDADKAINQPWLLPSLLFGATWR